MKRRALLALLLLALPAAAEDDAQVRQRVDGILSMYGPDAGVLIALIPEFLALEGKPAVPYLLSIVQPRLAPEAPAVGAEQVPTVLLLDAIGRIGDERALPVLERALSEGPTLQRFEVSGALARFHTLKSLDILIHGLAEKNDIVVTAIAESIRDDCRGLAGADATHRVLEAARKDKALKRGAVEAVALLGGTEAVDYMRGLLRDEDEATRLRAVQLLPKLAPPDAGAWFQPLLSDPSIRVRKEACISIGKLKSRELVPNLLPLLEPDVDGGLHKNALWALQQIAGQNLADNTFVWRRWWELNRPKPEEK